MTRATFEQDLRSRLHRQPFQPFIIEFNNGEQWVVGHKEVVSYFMGDSALYSWPNGSFDFVDCDNVQRFIDLVPAST